MGAYRVLLVSLLAAVVSCGSGTLTGSYSTGLEGTVFRGPIQPVCQTGTSCDAPFSAGFQVLQGGRSVAQFHSDSAGHYKVPLPPGQYTVIADSGAPVFPQGQPQDATVGATGFTSLDLHFDTGIR